MDLVDDGVKNKELLKNRFNFKYTKDKYQIDMVMTYTSNYSLSLIPYVNTGLTESGPHISLIKTILTKTFNRFLRDKKWLKEKDENLTGEDFQEGMYLVFNITAPGVSYDAQVKSRVTKIDMSELAGPINEALNNWFAANEKDVKMIADKALLAREAREKAKKAKEAVRNAGEKKNKALKFDSKLADCYSKDRLKCEIYITEGK
jgi:DNA gyrase subunit B